MIKTECIMNINEIEFINVVCPNCKSEFRLSLKWDFSGICPSCAERMSANHINEIRRCIYDMQTNEILKSKNTKIAFISKETK